MTARAFALSSLCFAANALAGQAPPVLAPAEKVADVTQAQYTALWWQWANRMRYGAKPYQDPTGAQCGLNQSGPVWFLAGTDGTDRVVRHCTVPKGKFLLLPVINMIIGSEPGKKVSCEQAKADASANNEHLAEARVEIDGVSVPDIPTHRLRSDCFSPFKDAPYQSYKDSYAPAAADGYWLMLKPLAIGSHRIVVYARYDNPDVPYGDNEQDFEYLLEVQDGGALDPDAPVI